VSAMPPSSLRPSRYSCIEQGLVRAKTAAAAWSHEKRCGNGYASPLLPRVALAGLLAGGRMRIEVRARSTHADALIVYSRRTARDFTLLSSLLVFTSRGGHAPRLSAAQRPTVSGVRHRNVDDTRSQFTDAPHTPHTRAAF